MRYKNNPFLLTLALLLLANSFVLSNDSEKIKMLWIDSEMGVFDVASNEQVIVLLDKCKEAGINCVALDVKNYAGLGFYNSKIVPKVQKWDGKDYPADFDLLKTMIEEGHKRSLRVFAAINVFSEGLKKDKIGPAYFHPDWEAIVYDKLIYLSIANVKGGKFDVVRHLCRNFSRDKSRVTSNDKKEIISINNRGDKDGLSLFDSQYGEKIYKKDAPQNTVDGNADSNNSVWISDDKTNTHFLEINFPSMMNSEKVKLFFVKGFIPRAYKISLMAKGNIIKSIDIKDNFLITPEYEIQDKTFVDTIRIEFTDCGFDNIARIREVQVFRSADVTSAKDCEQDDRTIKKIDKKDVLKNICIGENINADSSMNRGDGIFIRVKGSKVESFKSEKEIADDGITIPKDGYVLIADGNAKDWVKINLSLKEKVEFVTETKFFKESQYPKGTLVYVNPIHPEVQNRTLEIIKEIINNYEIDGIVLDRVRYDNFTIDFSDLSRKEFEKWLGKKLEKFPEDIYELPDPLENCNGAIYRTKDIKSDKSTLSSLKKGDTIKGKYYKEWIEWRAKNIKDFMIKICETVKASNKKIILGDYVGGWYPEYWEVGVNWASSNYDPSLDYDWATKTYKNTGYAELLDFLSPGLYYSFLTGEEAKQNGLETYNSIEGGIKLLEKVVGNATKIFVGLYYPNLYDKERFRNAVQLSLNKTDGIMIFSHHYFVKDDKWDVLKYALKEK